MTAQRWWVRAFARWQARVDASMQEINLGLRMVSSGGIGSGALKYFGYGNFVIPFLALLLGVIVTYAYLTFEGGVKNQVARDRQDMINNFGGPNEAIHAEMIARALMAAEKGRELTSEEREAISCEREQAFLDMRDGVEIADD